MSRRSGPASQADQTRASQEPPTTQTRASQAIPDYPSQGPGFPGQGLPGFPDYPGQGLPGAPEYPGQGLPRPPRPVYPIVEDHELGVHADLPDLNMTRRILITDVQDQYTAYALEPYPPEVEDDYEPRFPTKGLPGTWVVVLYLDSLVWAWVRTPGAPVEPEGPDEPERRAQVRLGPSSVSIPIRRNWCGWPSRSPGLVESAQEPLGLAQV